MERIDKSWYKKPKGIPEEECAGGVVVRKENKTILIILTREGDYPGLILPKGHIDKGETIEQTARREIKEETGIVDLQLICKLGVGERLDFQKTSWKKTHYFLFFTKQEKGFPTDPLHHQEIVWLEINNLSKMMWPEQKELIEINKEKIIKLLNI